MYSLYEFHFNFSVLLLTGSLKKKFRRKKVSVVSLSEREKKNASNFITLSLEAMCFESVVPVSSSVENSSCVWSGFCS